MSRRSGKGFIGLVLLDLAVVFLINSILDVAEKGTA